MFPMTAFAVDENVVLPYEGDSVLLTKEDIVLSNKDGTALSNEEDPAPPAVENIVSQVDENPLLAAEADAFYVRTEVVPKEVIEYAKNNFSSSASSIHIITEITSDKVILGTPFAYLDTYIFPIMQNGVITALFHVYKDTDEKYAHTTFKNFADELQSARKARTTGAVEVVLVNGNTEIRSIDAPQNAFASANVVNILDPIEYLVSSFVVPLELFLEDNEIQVSLPWCTAYAAAAIIKSKFRQKTPYALDIMLACYPGTPLYLLETMGLDNYKMVEYANRRNIYPVQYNGIPIFSFIQQQIDAGLYVLGQGDRYENNVFVAGHSVVIYGYNANEFIIHNPTEGRMFVSAGSSSFPGWRGRVYYWNGGYYRW